MLWALALQVYQTIVFNQKISNSEDPGEMPHKTGLPWSGKKSGKLKKFQVREKSGNFIFSWKFRTIENGQEFFKMVDVERKQASGNFIFHKLQAFILRNSFSHIHGLRFFLKD